MPKVTVIRSQQYEGRLRKMKISVNGIEDGYVRDGQDLTLQIAPGRHEMTASMDWCRVHLDLELLEADDEVFVKTGFSGSGLAMLFKPSKAIYLILADK